MDIDFAFICDYAEVAAKINALGIGFDTIHAAQVPTVHPFFHLVAQIRSSIAETGDKDLIVRLIDADGADIVPQISGSIAIGPAQPGSLERIGRLVVAFNNVRFPRYSEYAIHVVVQGQELIRIPLRVAPPPATT